MAEINSRKAALIAEIEISRGEIRSAARRAKTSANLVERARQSISHNLGSWIAAAGMGGFVISQIFRRGNGRATTTSASGSPSLEAKKGLFGGIMLACLKLSFELLKPSLLEWASTRFTQTTSAPKKARSSE